MFLAKNLLIGLGSVGVVGGGGYMIYNATKSGDEGSKIEEDSDQETGKNTSSVDDQTQKQSPQPNQQEPQPNSGDGNTKPNSSSEK